MDLEKLVLCFSSRDIPSHDSLFNFLANTFWFVSMIAFLPSKSPGAIAGAFLWTAGRLITKSMSDDGRHSFDTWLPYIFIVARGQSAFT